MQMPRASRRASFLVAGFLSFFAAGLVAPGPIAAQYSESSYFETWTDIATIYNFSDRFRYDGDYGFRAALSTASSISQNNSNSRYHLGMNHLKTDQCSTTAFPLYWKKKMKAMEAATH